MLYKTNVVARLVTVQYLLQLRLPLKEQMKEFSQTAENAILGMIVTKTCFKTCELDALAL